ncbi:DNA primase [Collibacillus ludicampi]|uniref:DNA primase n=1 Tax=Collibacillus ludicampi TaxID=2771369 RepID=UPI0024957D78|nr:DNA primase [Collibacillus ludicampi]
MWRRIPDEVIENVRQHFDIVDVVSEYVSLKRTGRSFVGLCPFHSEKTPSFSVSPDKQIFHCFGCGVGGNVFSFYMLIENVSFVEAVTHFAGRAGIHIPYEEVVDEESEEAVRRKKLFAANDLAAKYYHHILMNTKVGEPALEYLKGRGLTPGTIERFQLGYAPSAWDVLLRFLTKRGFSEDFLEEAGLLSKSQTDPSRYYDKFRNRVMFPIQDAQGRVVGFGGRVMDESHPKYLNTPETVLFHKGRHLYNFHRARNAIRQTKQAVLLEGYMDVIVAYQAGVENVVAALGTALTPDQARLLNRNAEEIVMVYDGDRAGQNAALRSSEVIKETGGSARVVVLPDGLDPDEFIRKHGYEAFERMIRDRSMSVTSFKLQKLREESQLSTQEGRIRFLTEAVRIISELKSPVERESYLRQLAGEFDVSLESLSMEVEVATKSLKTRKNGDIPPRMWNTNRDNGKQVVKESLQSKLPLPAHLEAERKLLSYMLIDEGAARQVQETLVDEFSVDEHAALAIHLYHFYGENEKPNPALFIAQLDDPVLIQLASELVVEAENLDMRPGLVEEYIQCIRRYPFEKRLKEIPREMEEALRNGDYALLRALQQEQLQLRAVLR